MTFVVILLLLIGSYLFVTGDSSLLARSTLTPYGIVLPTATTWLSDHEIMVERWAAGRLSYFRHDVYTGAEVEMMGLADMTGKLPDTEEGPKFSPDGRWVLFNTRPGTYLVSTRDTTAPRKWPTTGTVRWTGDGRHVVEFLTDRLDTRDLEDYTYSRMVVYSVDPLEPLQHLRAEWLSLGEVDSGAVYVKAIDYVALQTPTRYVLALPANADGSNGDGKITSWTISDGKVQMRSYPIDFGPVQFVTTAAAAPEGDRVAWMVGGTEHSPLEHWAHRLIPSYAVHDADTSALWVSRTDGNHHRLIGTFRVDGYGSPDLIPSDLQWLPGGKRISFVYKGSLYVTSAE